MELSSHKMCVVIIHKGKAVIEVYLIEWIIIFKVSLNTK